MANECANIQKIMKNITIKNSEIVRMLCMDAKVLVGAYATLQSALVTIVQTEDESLMNDSFNNIVNMFAKEVGLSTISESDLILSPTYEECCNLVDARLRVTNFLTALVLGSFLEEEVLSQFYDKLEELAEQQKEVIRKLLSEDSEKNVN